ncbi:putrescine ABC transporter permease PotI, partial [Pseudomonas sp. 9.1(2019)]|nr:putrescine ABC transporter permease PotI [Pseudomonas sp. 9.1(2019)]
EEHRKKAIQQAIDEASAESWKQPDVRRPKSLTAV